MPFKLILKILENIKNQCVTFGVADGDFEVHIWFIENKAAELYPKEYSILWKCFGVGVGNDVNYITAPQIRPLRRSKLSILNDSCTASATPRCRPP